MRFLIYVAVAATGVFVGCGLLPGQTNQKLVAPLAGEWSLHFQGKEWGQYSFGVNYSLVFKKLETCGIAGETSMKTAPAQFGTLPETWVLELKCGDKPNTFLFSLKNERSVVKDLPINFTDSAGFTGKGRLTQYRQADYPVEVAIKPDGVEYEWRVVVPWEKEKDKIGIDYRFTLSRPKAATKK